MQSVSPLLWMTSQISSGLLCFSTSASANVRGDADSVMVKEGRGAGLINGIVPILETKGFDGQIRLTGE